MTGNTLGKGQRTGFIGLSALDICVKDLGITLDASVVGVFEKLAGRRVAATAKKHRSEGKVL